MDGEAFRMGGHLGSSPAPYPSNAMENPNQNQFLFDARSAPRQLQLFGNPGVPAVSPAGYCNYTGNNHLSVMNQARNTNIDRGDEKQLKLQMSLNNYNQEEAGRLARVGNPSGVSTGLRLSYEDDERNSSITSGSGSMSSLPATMSFADDLMAEMDKENKEISYYLRLQAEQISKHMKEVNQRQLILLLANLERAVGKKLREKELEAEAVNRKSKELNEQIRQVALEVQSWQSAALYNQSVANNLKSRLMQVVAQNTHLTREGCGDSEEEEAASGHNVNATPGGFFQSSVLGSRSAAVGLGACRQHSCLQQPLPVPGLREECRCVPCLSVPQEW
ncbi:hypothetical protein EJB05_25364 [Eragrostis curvula]|uniref:Uncharacterized protein n=1 Tax=Eragrostis curvula TaxID=38414 RepID=A0A5J9VF77_9POAL|nr:hypothetical protein EJB05_25364 [Eragrostis curvula]